MSFHDPFDSFITLAFEKQKAMSIYHMLLFDATINAVNTIGVVHCRGMQHIVVLLQC